MNRRNLFRSLTAVVVASSMEVMGFTTKPPRVLLKINPAWENAAYQEIFYFHPNIIKSLIPDGKSIDDVIIPSRYDSHLPSATPIPKWIPDLSESSDASRG